MPLSLTSSRHLWNAALLVAATVIALVASRLAEAPVRRPAPRPAADVAGFVLPVGADSALPRYALTIPLDPFVDAAADRFPVASDAPAPTVPPATPRGRRLTAILVADERRVAVVDEQTVSVGSVLQDGARVSRIEVDRVWVVDRSGRWQMLTLTRGQ